MGDAYMQFRELLRRRLSYLPTAKAYSKLSETEDKVLATMITTNGGNAYRSWKASGLKHYPTVLRTLKKLEEKRLVKVSAENGIRNEKIYVPTLFGRLLHHALRDDKAKLTETLSQNSTLFRELSVCCGVDDSLFYANSIIYEMVSDVAGGKSRTINDILREYFDLEISNELLNIVYDSNREHWNKIIEISKVEWIKELAIDFIENEFEWCRKYVKKLEELRETLSVK